MLKRLFNRIPAFLKNKYLLSGLVFLVFVIFFDGNNFLSQYRLRKELNSLKAELKYLREETKKDSAELSLLKNDTLEMERIGREYYQMKRDSEDIYIIVRKPIAKKQ